MPHRRANRTTRPTAGPRAVSQLKPEKAMSTPAARHIPAPSHGDHASGPAKAPTTKKAPQTASPASMVAIATRNRASTLRLTPRGRSLRRVPVFDSAVPLSVCDAALVLPGRPYTSREASGRALVRRRLARQRQSLLPARVRSCSAVMSMFQPAHGRHPPPRDHGLAKEADATWEVVESGRQSSSEIASSGQDSAASSQHPASSQTEPAMT